MADYLHPEAAARVAADPTFRPYRTDFKDFAGYAEHKRQAAEVAGTAGARALRAAYAIDGDATAAALGSSPQPEDAACFEKRAVHSHLLRDLFGPLPFRPVTVEPSWRTPKVLALAQVAYNDRLLPSGASAPDRLPVLADALEAAGCTDADILPHLRSPGLHVRGCWALDAVLGKS